MQVEVTFCFLFQARNFVLLREETHWIITNLDAGTIDLSAYELTKVRLTSFSLVPLAQRKASVLQALAADAVTTVALGLDQSIVQGNDSQALDWDQNGTLLDQIKQVSFEGRTGWVSFNQGGSRRNVSIDVIENDGGNLTKVRPIKKSSKQF
ncbi:uncharacterized protein LOC118408426 [Branchiostoma floridae]|uniref:Uncharacterized protein LOC118408426 n=1 Tax=Branchiostoma floridae TaxID=7739 RepID=A0A9J7HVC9_BRAFL|nr:uncharacterized protein LOC118408426 [Branchiostoma floridae]